MRKLKRLYYSRFKVYNCFPVVDGNRKRAMFLADSGRYSAFWSVIAN